MGRKVITLDADKFGSECERLEDLVISSGFKPDLVISILTGGLYVGESIFPDVPHVSVKLQRPSTAKKGSSLRKILKRLPRPLLDRLRIAEAWWLERKGHPASVPQVTLPPISGARQILVVDDAVDSGATLMAVVNAAKNAVPQAIVRSAVITQTTLLPMAAPDYALYNDKTLIRFPWSLDA